MAMYGACELYPVFVRHCAVICGLMFSPVQQSDVIYVNEMGPNYTHMKRFVRGVVEHSELDSCAEVTLTASTEYGRHAVFHVPTCDFRHCDL